MNRLQRCALPLLVLCLTLAGSALSQTSSTSLQGTVTDPSGSAVVGAAVSLVNPESKAERTVVSGAQGEYRFLLLPPGTYTLNVTAKGFARYEQTGLQLLVNTPATVNVQLKIGSGTETVTVTGEAPVLDMVDASLGNSSACGLLRWLGRKSPPCPSESSPSSVYCFSSFSAALN